MCGIAGIMFKGVTDGAATGKALIDMLDGCQHRGPDSTGFALYGATREGQLRMRFFVGDDADADSAVERIRETLSQQNAPIIDQQRVGTTFQVVVEFSDDLQQLAYAVEHAAIMARGKSIEVSDLPPAATLVTAGGGGAVELLQREVARWAVEQTQPLDATTTEASLYEDFIQAVEPPLLKAVLERCGHNRAAAARLLGLHRATLRQKLKNHGITGPDDEP